MWELVIFFLLCNASKIGRSDIKQTGRKKVNTLSAMSSADPSKILSVGGKSYKYLIMKIRMKELS